MIKESICQVPYTTLNIHEKGDVYLCCDAWVRYYSVGNIFTNTFDEIWNGERAREFRKQFADNNYKYCRLDICQCRNYCGVKATEEAKTFPETVVLTYDPICNVDCIFCAIDKKPALTQFEEKLDEWLPDIARNAKTISLNGYGEALASKHSRNVIKKCIEVNPEIKFEIQTNGLLANFANFKNLGIENNIERLLISVHAAKEKTYNKLIKNSDFKTVMKNLKEIAELKEKGQIKYVEIKFVITSINYKEMIEIAQIAKNYAVNISFLSLVWSDICLDLDKNLDVTKENHPNYNSFINVIKHPIFKESFININPSLFKLKKVSFIKSLQNKINFAKEEGNANYDEYYRTNH